jgi:hypothetical protein
MCVEMSWDEARGYGRLPAESPRTDFFDEYHHKDVTDMGRQLVERRLALLRQYVSSREGVIDVGIGGGAFVTACFGARGLDVDPKAIEWLKERKLQATLADDPVALTFWDSFEHIDDPIALLRGFKPSYVVMSIPLFAGREAALASKHYKPGEHIWYFTFHGLLEYMDPYRCVHVSRMEELLGREGIATLVFADQDEAMRLRCLT